MNLVFPIESNIVEFTSVPTRLVKVFEHKGDDGGESVFKVMFKENLVAEIYRGSVTFNNNTFCMYQLRDWKAEVIREVSDVYQGIINLSKSWISDFESSLLDGVVASLELIGLHPKSFNEVVWSLNSMVSKEGLIEIIEIMYIAKRIWKEARQPYISFGHLGEVTLNEDEAFLLSGLFLKNSKPEAVAILNTTNQSHLVPTLQKLYGLDCQKSINHLRGIWEDAVEEFESSLKEIKSIPSVIAELRSLGSD